MATIPFTGETAIQRVGLAEDGWNSRDPGRVALASRALPYAHF
jgi:nuclear transport factor 2 (NTF2) superfamily protein